MWYWQTVRILFALVSALLSRKKYIFVLNDLNNRNVYNIVTYGGRATGGRDRLSHSNAFTIGYHYHNKADP